MNGQHNGDDLLNRLAKRKVWLWVLGVSVPTVGCGGILFLVAIAAFGVIAMVFLAGIGFWSHLFVGPPPPMGTPTARATEWLHAVDQADPAFPAALGLAVIAQASGGEVYGDRYFCITHGLLSGEHAAGESCTAAYGKTATQLGIAYGLLGLNNRRVSAPSATSGQTWHSVAWNLHTGLERLATDLARQGYLKAALPIFHHDTQTPPGWTSTGYVTKIRANIATYGGPQMAAWAIAGWGKVSRTYQDPHGAKEWVIVTAAAPTGTPWSLEWKPPTIKYVTKTKTVPTTKTVQVKVQVQGQTHIVVHNVSVNGKTITTHSVVHTHAHTVTQTKTIHGTKTVHYVVRKVITHNLTGHALEQPLSVTVTLNNGQTRNLTFSAMPKSPVPVWPGGQVWGGQFDLQNIRSVTAYWPGVHEVIPWPPVSNQAVGTVKLVNETQSIGGWWSDIQVASQQTGVPASLIAAIMVHESGGDAGAYNAQGPAYGLMQILSSTAVGLPGYNPSTWTQPQENLILGAELLTENEHQTGGWHAAIAAYYGGLTTMESDGYTPGMPWSEASGILNVVPASYAGNTQTMTSYADQMVGESQIIAQHERHKSAKKG